MNVVLLLCFVDFFGELTGQSYAFMSLLQDMDSRLFLASLMFVTLVGWSCWLQRPGYLLNKMSKTCSGFLFEFSVTLTHLTFNF